VRWHRWHRGSAGHRVAHRTEDFRHYVDKHRPLVAKHIVGYEVVDHPSENQLVALAGKFFLNFNQVAGRPATRA
jgi:hypothetical protein